MHIEHSNEHRQTASISLGRALTLANVVLGGSLTDPESALMSAINRHASVSMRLAVVLKQRNNIWENSQERPEPEIRVAEVVERREDYPSEYLCRVLKNPGSIERLFNGVIGLLQVGVFAPARKRVAGDRVRALELYSQRLASLDNWYDDSGFQKVSEELQDLEDEQEAMERAICEMPCTSTRMLLLKAAFGEALLRQNDNDTPDGLLMRKLLHSMLPAGEVQ
ncbi:hypothetical protein ASC97_01285 [Rhizobium sp. Root1203]|uniref:hypothetical protein n=1 Tax=Rhizobium sp. Root1203 TaxID=1736427 RepID=UPI00070E85B8|nr:hypothetical protein [Rhizobium sp. Root1203]KQV32259.1 hypothetical protein ASC97_01285 [Rhizobium sp. Root1203]